jgi:aryl-alcohol dehydrogenase-like predicted oxidoreductase
LLDAGRRCGRGLRAWQPDSPSRPGELADTNGTLALRRVLAPITARHGATIPQVTLAWLLARSPAVMPIPATTSLGHLEENLAAQDLELTARTSRLSTAWPRSARSRARAGSVPVPACAH